MIWFLLWYIFWTVAGFIHDKAYNCHWTIEEWVKILLIGWFFFPIFAIKDMWDEVTYKVSFEKKGFKKGKA